MRTRREIRQAAERAGEFKDSRPGLRLVLLCDRVNTIGALLRNKVLYPNLVW